MRKPIAACAENGAVTARPAYAIGAPGGELSRLSAIVCGRMLIVFEPVSPLESRRRERDLVVGVGVVVVCVVKSGRCGTGEVRDRMDVIAWCSVMRQRSADAGSVPVLRVGGRAVSGTVSPSL